MSEPKKPSLNVIAGVEVSAKLDEIMGQLDRRWHFNRETGERRPGRPLPSLKNLILVLGADPRWEGRLRRNVFTGLSELDERLITDEAETGIALWLAEHYDFEAGEKKLHRAVLYVVSQNKYHPVQTYLSGLQWDGTKRLGGWLYRYIGTPQTGLRREIGARWMISCVARVMRPGCKVDTTLILVGAQGKKKSSAFGVLAGAWFCDSPLDFRSKDAMASLQGVWLYELGELDSLQRRESSTVKAFLSRREDRFRPAFGRNIVERKRETIFVGTTNESEFLADQTGSRRFWPVPVGEIDLDALHRDRDQLWAEAMVAFQAGQRWWLEGESEEALEGSSEPYRQVDAWEEVIEGWIEDRNIGWSITELLTQCLEIPKERQTMGTTRRAAAILSRMGCVKARSRMWGRRWRWFRSQQQADVVAQGGKPQH
ncbi:MAG: putative DNA primase/helicase [Myxococcota bacterium]|jgi:putative DNA primase/helicase